ncbi:MAG: peptidylprolyl isomerase A [Desulfuromonas sp.]|nr:MAG: peptidylprolyl isomerase A [Desulfuromonas sp.]
MRTTILTILLATLLFAGSAFAAVQVKMETSAGTITLELDDKKAPLTVANFLKYVDEGFYSGTIFHRVIKDFMIQGGGFDTDLKRKPTAPPVKNEADNGLKNKRGTIAMARTQIVDSATSQFFINHKDNAFLDFKDKSTRGYGYAVFGKVVSGMEVVDKIANAPVKKGVGPFANLPATMVEIVSVKRIDK